MSPRRVAVVLGVLVLVVTSGCVSVQAPSNEPEPEAVFEGAFVHSEDLEDVSGTVTVEVTDANGTITETLRVAERPYVEYRDEVINSSAPHRVGDRYVSNATITWWYYPNAGMAEYVEADEPFDSEAVRSDRADRAAELSDLYDLEYQGTEEIAGREAHVLDVEAKEEAVERGISVLVGDTEYVYAVDTIEKDAREQLNITEQKIWIDAEYEYPLKERLVYEGPEGNRNVMVEEFETVSFNEGLDDEAFEFEPPEDAVVYELPEEYDEGGN